MALSIYDSNVKKYGVKENMNVPRVAMLTFAREQQQQMQHIVNRYLFDLTVSEINENNAKDDNTKEAYRQKAAEYAATVKQTVKSLEIVNELVKELEDELDN